MKRNKKCPNCKKFALIVEYNDCVFCCSNEEYYQCEACYYMFEKLMEDNVGNEL